MNIAQSQEIEDSTESNFAQRGNKDGVLIVMDYTAELIINTISTISEDIAKNSLRKIFYKDEN